MSRIIKFAKAGGPEVLEFLETEVPAPSPHRTGPRIPSGLIWIESDHRRGGLASCTAGTSGDAGEGSERGADDVPIHPNAKNGPAVRQLGFNIGRCLRI